MFFLALFAFNEAVLENLINKAKKGDESAFCDLVGDMEPLVYNFALRMMNGNHQDAEDMAQEAFLRVYKSLTGYKAEASFKTWVLRICKNVCLDEMRKRSVRVVAGEEVPEVVADSTDVQGEVVDNERREMLKNAINSLEERAKMLIVMRDINGLSYKEISQTTGLEQGTVKSALNRARKKLREIIGEQNII